MIVKAKEHLETTMQYFEDRNRKVKTLNGRMSRQNLGLSPKNNILSMGELSKSNNGKYSSMVSHDDSRVDSEL